MFVTRPTAPRFYYSLAAVIPGDLLCQQSGGPVGCRMATCWRHAANERSIERDGVHELRVAIAERPASGHGIAAR